MSLILMYYDLVLWNPIECFVSGGYVPIYQPLRSGRILHKVNDFKRSLTGLNSEFSFF